MFRSSRDRVLAAFLRGMAAISGLIVLLILAFVAGESQAAFSQIGLLRFWSDNSWHPAAEAYQGTFNLLPIVAGTLLTSIVAIILATPLGICSAAFTEFYAPSLLARWYRRMIELMAGIPSVVYGLWGLVVLVPFIARIHPPGQSIITGVVILTLMILPTVALLSSAAFAAVPREYAQGAVALGLSRSTTTFFVMVPAARSGIATAILLGLVRAVGETMAVVMVCGNVVRMPSSPFDPVRTLTATIALEMGYARGDHRAALFLCGLVLLGFVIVLIGIAEIISRGKLDGAA